VFAQPGATHPVTTDTVLVGASGDLAYTVGRWHVTVPSSGSDAQGTDAGGRYLAVWRPVGPGRAWRIVALSANAHRPAPPM
jgi:ketosteroid isomerase-like protein